jgi:hypothetical protein
VYQSFTVFSFTSVSSIRSIRSSRVIMSGSMRVSESLQFLVGIRPFFLAQAGLHDAPTAACGPQRRLVQTAISWR